MKYMKADKSKRIYNELLEVIDASDVLCEILDARDPLDNKMLIFRKFYREKCLHKF